MTGTCISFSFLHLPAWNEGTNGRRRGPTFPCRLLRLWNVSSKKSFCSVCYCRCCGTLVRILRSFPPCDWTARETRAVLHHSVMWDRLSWICVHRDVHAADSAHWGGGYIKELSSSFPELVTEVFVLGWWSSTVLLCHSQVLPTCRLFSLNRATF